MNVSTLVTLASTIVVAAATVVLVGLTYRYVRLTQGLLEEARAAKEPSVTLDLEFPDRFGRVAIGNSGGGSAHAVRFSVTEDVTGLGLHPRQGGLRELPVIINGVSYLKPGQTLRFPISRPRSWPTTPGQQVVAVDITYRNSAGRTFTQSVAIDLSQYLDVLPESFEDPSRAVAKAILDVDSRRWTERSSRRLFSHFLPRGTPKPGAG